MGFKNSLERFGGRVSWIEILRNPSVELRFWSYVDLSDKDNCWLWYGGITPDGYGIFNPEIMSGTIRAYVASYYLSKQMMPIGRMATVCHLCDNKRCVRPDHLEVHPFSWNVRDYFYKRRNDLIGKILPYDSETLRDK